MGCINPDGTFTQPALKLLAAIDHPMTEEEIVKIVKRPVYRVRISLRDLVEMGMLRKIDDRFEIATDGEKKLIELYALKESN
jgi:hypothetical protein